MYVLIGIYVCMNNAEIMAKFRLYNYTLHALLLLILTVLFIYFYISSHLILIGLYFCLATNVQYNTKDYSLFIILMPYGLWLISYIYKL